MQTENLFYEATKNYRTLSSDIMKFALSTFSVRNLQNDFQFAM